MLALQTDLMQCEEYGLSTDRLTSHSFKFCSNVGNTQVFPFLKPILEVKLTGGTHLLWSTVMDHKCIELFSEDSKAALLYLSVHSFYTGASRQCTVISSNIKVSFPYPGRNMSHI